MRPELRAIMRRVSMSPLIDGGADDAAIRLVLNSLCEGLNVARGGVWFLDEARSALRCRLLVDRHAGTEFDAVVLHQRDYPAYFEALQHERAIPAHDARTDPSTCEFTADYLVPLNIHAMLDVPIRHHGTMIGVVCAEHLGAPRTWSDDDIAFAGSLGDLVGRALNARQQRDTQVALACLNQELEDRVAQRTAEVVALRDQLVETDKMAALGGLVAGVAHEINTPLGVSVTAASLLREAHNQFGAALASGQLRRSQLQALLQQQQQAMDLLETNLRRAATLVDSFKQTAVDQCTDPLESVELEPLLARTLMSLSPITKAVCDSVHLSAPGDLSLQTYPGSLIQVVTNLLTNAARHAFPTPRPDAQLSVTVEATAGGGAELAVCDNGVGIDPSLRRRVFEPFFTTRRGEGGSGLGLSIAYNLVSQRLGGRLSLDSKPGQGACFRVRLPAVAPSLPSVDQRAGSPDGAAMPAQG